MDQLHLYGVEIIEKLQQTFPDYSQQMLVASHLGDPRNAFLIYFPIAYFLCPSLGVTVMWVAAGSEWFNAALKWLLFGHRPYWWVNISPLYDDLSRPKLQQYQLTCETGPGSPSGHAMITSAVVYLLFSALSRNAPQRRYLYWSLYGAFMLCVCVSRCFIATHFPHQVVAGTIVGCCLGILGEKCRLSSASLRWYILASVFILISSPAQVYMVDRAGWDAGWSIELAVKWCAKQEWIYLDTTPMYSITRDASQLLGMGLAYTFSKRDKSPGIVYKISAIAVSLAFARSLESVRIPSATPAQFYFLAFVKNMSFPIVIVAVIPVLLSFLKNKKANSKNS